MTREIESLSQNKGLRNFSLSGVAKCRLKGDMSVSAFCQWEKSSKKCEQIFKLKNKYGRYKVVLSQTNLN